MERRRTPRVESGVPVEFDTTTDRELLGIGQNVSTKGLLLLSRVEHTPGERLTLRFRTQGRSGDIAEVLAHVVRSEANHPESLWPIKSALEFDHEVNIRLDQLEDPH